MKDLAHVIRKGRIMAISCLLTAAVSLPAASVHAGQINRPDSGWPKQQPHTGSAQTQEAEEFADRFFEQEKVAGQLAGAVVVLVKDNKILLQKGYGFADVAAQTPMSADTSVFRVASISKLFTATSVMQLAEQGEVDLHRDINDYLGGMIIPNQTGKALTMEHLLTHTSGFDYTDSVGGAGSDIPNAQFIREHMPTVVRVPGEAYRYDNYAYNLQGYIVERLSGKPFGDYVQERIFRPLGMESSSFRLTPELRKHLVTPYTAALAPIPEYPSTPAEAPDGGMFSTGADMAKFMLAQLNGGQAEGGGILTPGSIDSMQSIHHQIHADVPGSGYGFESFYQEHYNGQRVIGKGGDLPGYHSWMWLLPEQKAGGFVIFNRDGADLRGAFFKAFMDHYYPAAPEALPTGASSPSELESLSGMYQDLRLPFWIIQVSTDDRGQLIITDPYGRHVLREKEPLLFVDEDGNKAAFQINSNGSQYASYRKMDSWFKEVPNAEGFEDVGSGHPYASWINEASQLGLIVGKEGKLSPETAMTRAEFVASLMQLTGLPPSSSPAGLFEAQSNSSQDNPSVEGYARRAVEVGFVQGREGTEDYALDAAITRQEAAVFMWRAAMMAGVPVSPAPAADELSGEIDDWALDAVKYVVKSRMFGPDVLHLQNGLIDYRSREPMLRQEAMALLVEFCKKISLTQ